MRTRASETVTLKIPRPLYESLRRVIAGTGFRSVTEFAVYVLRDLVAHPGKRGGARGEEAPGGLTEEELEAARERLRELGYL